jgi:hypothetical protein
MDRLSRGNEFLPVGSNAGIGNPAERAPMVLYRKNRSLLCDQAFSQSGFCGSGGMAREQSNVARAQAAFELAMREADKMLERLMAERKAA